MRAGQNDVAFVTDLALTISKVDRRRDVDFGAFQSAIDAMMAKVRHASLKDIAFGRVLQDMTQISVRHGVPLPADLLLAGKALAQMQLATAELDPALDMFAVAGEFMMRMSLDEFRERMDVRKLFYEGRKLKMRAGRLVDAVEALTGARPGPKLQVEFRGAEGLEQQIRRSSRRLSLAVAATGALLGAAITASSRLDARVPATLGAAAAAAALGLAADALPSKGGRGRS